MKDKAKKHGGYYTLTSSIKATENPDPDWYEADIKESTSKESYHKYIPQYIIEDDGVGEGGKLIGSDYESKGMVATLWAVVQNLQKRIVELEQK